jgi:hypothetical protein
VYLDRAIYVRSTAAFTCCPANDLRRHIACTMAVPDAYMPLAIQRWAFDIGRANYILSTSAHDKRMLDLYIEKISRVLDDVAHVVEHLPADQVEAASRELVMLLALLREVSSVAVDSTIDGQLQVLRHQLPLHGGRPELDIDAAWLSTAVNQLRLPLTTIADTLGCSARTVRRILLESGIRSAGSASRLSSALSEGDLDTIVAQQLERQPGCGVCDGRGQSQAEVAEGDVSIVLKGVILLAGFNTVGARVTRIR